MMLNDDDLPVLTPREEIASLILIHNNGIGTRELVEAEEGSDHQFERQASLRAADAILEMLRTREDLEETNKRLVAAAFAPTPSKP
jgi:hypothetical protein